MVSSGAKRRVGLLVLAVILWGVLSHSPGLVLCIGAGGHFALEFGCGPEREACSLPKCPDSSGTSTFTLDAADTCCVACSDIPLVPHGANANQAADAKRCVSGLGVGLMVSSHALPAYLDAPDIKRCDSFMAGGQLRALLRSTVLLT